MHTFSFHCCDTALSLWLAWQYETVYTSLQAMQDFNNRIKEYEKVYVPLTDGKSNRHIHFIQLVNMVTGRGYMDVNRISGYIPGKIVFFLMQACGPPAARDLTRCSESDKIIRLRMFTT